MGPDLCPAIFTILCLDNVIFIAQYLLHGYANYSGIVDNENGGLILVFFLAVWSIGHGLFRLSYPLVEIKKSS
jgi:hypothetical protein